MQRLQIVTHRAIELIDQGDQPFADAVYVVFGFEPGQGVPVFFAEFRGKTFQAKRLTFGVPGQIANPGVEAVRGGRSREESRRRPSTGAR